jgi:hypothetical protein
MKMPKLNSIIFRNMFGLRRSLPAISDEGENEDDKE